MRQHVRPTKDNLYRHKKKQKLLTQNYCVHTVFTKCMPRNKLKSNEIPYYALQTYRIHYT